MSKFSMSDKSLDESSNPLIIASFIKQLPHLLIFFQVDYAIRLYSSYEHISYAQYGFSLKDLIRFYCRSSSKENFIKECKTGFVMSCVSNSPIIVNTNHIPIYAIYYNFFNWFSCLSLPKFIRKDRIDIVRLGIMLIAAQILRCTSPVCLKLCNYCSYKQSSTKHSPILANFHKKCNRIWVHLDSFKVFFPSICVLRPFDRR